MNLRKMEIEDYENLVTLWKHVPGVGLNEDDSVEHIRAFLRRNDGFSFVCEDEDRLVGSILCGHDGRRGYIYHLAVTEDNRGWGYGRKLVRKCLEALESKGITKVHLFVARNNEGAIRFWDQLGWVKRSELYMYSKEL